jgi:hypothetical protein
MAGPVMTPAAGFGATAGAGSMRAGEAPGAHAPPASVAAATAYNAAVLIRDPPFILLSFVRRGLVKRSNRLAPLIRAAGHRA